MSHRSVACVAVAVAALTAAACGDDTSGSTSGGGSDGAGSSATAEAPAAGGSGSDDGESSSDGPSDASSSTSSGGGGTFEEELCGNYCDCNGCSADDLDECITQLAELRAEAASDGCGAEYDAYERCIFPTEDCEASPDQCEEEAQAVVDCGEG